MEYWRKQLAGSLPDLQLPTDRSRPAVQTSHGAAYYFMLPSTTLETLKALSQQEGVTLFMALLAAFKALLYRYTGQTDLLVGTPVANRNHSEIEGLIGFFVNTLVLRTDLSGDPTFRDLLQRVRKASLGAFEHQHHLEERGVAERAGGLEGLDQRLERQVLVGVGVEGGGAHLLQQLAEGQAGGEAGAQHQGVDEEADQALRLSLGAAGDRRADQDVVLAAVARQQRLECGQQGHKQRGALGTGERFDLC